MFWLLKLYYSLKMWLFNFTYVILIKWTELMMYPKVYYKDNTTAHGWLIEAWLAVMACRILLGEHMLCTEDLATSCHYFSSLSVLATVVVSCGRWRLMCDHVNTASPIAKEEIVSSLTRVTNQFMSVLEILPANLYAFQVKPLQYTQIIYASNFTCFLFKINISLFG